MDSSKLCHDDADIFCAFGDFDADQFFNCEGVAEVVAHGGEVVEAVGEGHILEIGVALADFLVVAVQVAHNRFEIHDGLAVEGGCDTEYAVCGGVLWA